MTAVCSPNSLMIKKGFWNVAFYNSGLKPSFSFSYCKCYFKQFWLTNYIRYIYFTSGIYTKKIAGETEKNGW